MDRFEWLEDDVHSGTVAIAPPAPDLASVLAPSVITHVCQRYEVCYVKCAPNCPDAIIGRADIGVVAAAAAPAAPACTDVFELDD